MNEDRSSGGKRVPRRRAARARKPATEVAIALADGRRLAIRAIRPDDVDALQRGFARLAPEQIRQRVFHRMTELSREDAQLLCNVDLANGAAYVAVDTQGEIRGEARLHAEAGTAGAEFALVVDPAFLGFGIGRALMQRLIDESRRRGLQELWGSVLAGNALMLDFASSLGALREAVPDEPDLVRVRFDLGNP